MCVYRGGVGSQVYYYVKTMAVTVGQFAGDNTVVVDGRGASPVWCGFGVRRDFGDVVVASDCSGTRRTCRDGKNDARG